MKTIEIGGSLAELEALVRRREAPREPVALTKDGAPYATLIPAAPRPDSESRAVWASPAFRALLEEGRRASAKGREQDAAAVFHELGVTAEAVQAAVDEIELEATDRA